MPNMLKLKKKVKEYATKADAYLNKNNYSKACECFINASKKLKEIILIEENENEKEEFRKEALQYLQRAQLLIKNLSDTFNITSDESSNKSIIKYVNLEELENNMPNQISNELKNYSVTSCVTMEIPSVKWGDVIGLTNAKSVLQSLFTFYIKYPQFFKGNGKKWKGILLYGPSGSGKSYIAKACTTEFKGTFFSVSACYLLNESMEVSWKLFSEISEMLKTNRTPVILIDEIDVIFNR